MGSETKFVVCRGSEVGREVKKNGETGFKEGRTTAKKILSGKT